MEQEQKHLGKQVQNINRERVAMRVSFYSIVVNLLLSVGKFAAGILGHSAAMVSDAVHSASDVLSTFIVIAGVKISGKASDDDHQYGHERLECVASIILATLLAVTGLGIGYEGYDKIVNHSAAELAIPTMMPLVAAVASIVLKEAMFWYTRAAARTINSDALMADAWHHRSDALSSIGSFVGILGARMGYPILDPIASILICFMILQAAHEIFKDAIDKMVDKACPLEIEEAMSRIICNVPGVQHIDLLQTRMFGSRIFVDVEITAEGTLTLLQGHSIAEQVHRAIELEFPDVKHCMVHVNPDTETLHDF